MLNCDDFSPFFEDDDDDDDDVKVDSDFVVAVAFVVVAVVIIVVFDVVVVEFDVDFEFCIGGEGNGRLFIVSREFDEDEGEETDALWDKTRSF